MTVRDAVCLMGAVGGAAGGLVTAGPVCSLRSELAYVDIGWKIPARAACPAFLT